MTYASSEPTSLRRLPGLRALAAAAGWALLCTFATAADVESVLAAAENEATGMHTPRERERSEPCEQLLELWLAAEARALQSLPPVAAQHTAPGSRLGGLEQVARRREVAQAFEPEFRQLAENGSRAARTWLLDRAHDRGLADERERASFASDVQALGRELDPTWLHQNGPALWDLLAAAGRHFEPEWSRAIFEAATAGIADPSLLARARLAEARAVQRADPRLAAILLEQVRGLAPGSAWGEQSLQAAWQLEHLAGGARPPTFVTSDVDGNEIRLADFTGRPVVVAFWNPGSPSQRVFLEQLIANLPLASGEVTLLAVAEGVPREAFRRLIEAAKLPRLMAFEEAGLSPAREAWRIAQGEPIAYLLDVSGRVAGRPGQAGEAVQLAERAKALVLPEPASPGPASPGPSSPGPSSPGRGR